MSVAAVAAEPAVADSNASESASLLAEFHAVEAELGEAGNDDAAEPSETPERGPDGKFLPKDKKPAAKVEAKPKAEPEKPEEPKDERKDRVAPAERAAFREEKRRERAKLASQAQEIAQQRAQLEAFAAQVNASSPAKLKELSEAGRMDEIAQIIGHKDWNALNDHVARQYASPEYRRIRQLEQEREAEKKERAEQMQAWQQRQAQEQRAAVDAQAATEITETLKAGSDPELAALAEDPPFAAAVVRRIRQAHAQHDEIDLDEAIQEVADGARSMYERLHKVFGGRQPSHAEAPRGAIPNRAGKETTPARPVNKHVPRNSATEASPPADESDWTNEQWNTFMNQELHKAAAEERRLEQKRR